MAKEGSRKLLGITLRGIAMGAADVIPGVSGGTIAFITGIYEELLETIAGLKFGLIKIWRKEGFKAMWREGNFGFLFSLFLGIGISIASLAVFIEYLLENHPIHLWSFFFGLIIASIWLVGKTVKEWKWYSIVGLLGGAVLAYFITIMTPVTGTDEINHGYIFLCGSIAICAMILPGISGSFILLLLGAYTTVLGSITGAIEGLKLKDWDAVWENGFVIAIFLLGCLAGLISFSKLLNWLFKKSKNLIIAVLTGFLVGSLNKIWPWKETVETIKKHAGTPEEVDVPLVQNNIGPGSFESLHNEPSHVAFAIILMVVGFVLILSIEKVGAKFKKEPEA